jgi:hypothetical protein
VFLFSEGAALYASNFTSGQIRLQLAPQQIFFPKDTAAGLPANLSQYAGQQVLNGDQPHAYAEQFIGLHLQEIGKGHLYSYWSGLAQTETNPTVKAQDQATADTLFKGNTLRTMLDTAWTFSVIGQIALFAAIGLLVASLIILAALTFEVVEVVRGRETAEVVAAEAGTALATVPLPVN